MNEIDIARVCHEANRSFCEALGDQSQEPWETAPEWAKESAIAGVRSRLEAGPDADPSNAHAAWRAHKEAEGWIYGEKKDPWKKTHPCMVPFDKLPPEQQAKDHLFCGIVDALGKLLELNGARNSEAAQ